MREIVHQWLCPRGLLVGGIFQYAFTVLTMVYLACSSLKPSNENVWLGILYQVCGIQTTQASTNCSHRHRY